MNDYRCACDWQLYPSVAEIHERKKSFVTSHTDHSNDWYRYVKDHKDDFFSVYDSKCVYCGVSLGIVIRSQFEIDHFVCQATNKPCVNELSNLVLACRKCNNSKRQYVIPNDKRELFHPDNGHLPELFCREKDYSVSVQQRYVNDGDVNEFYRVLKLDSILRRLDFLSMKIDMWVKKYSNGNMNDKILYCYLGCLRGELLKLRNRMV